MRSKLRVVHCDFVLQRRFGLSLKGCRLYSRGNFTRGQRYSVLAALSTKGIISAHSIIGAYDRVQFEFCFEQFILPYVGSFAKNEDCSVVVLDNCTIHYSDRIIQMVRRKGGLIIFLP